MKPDHTPAEDGAFNALTLRLSQDFGLTSIASVANGPAILCETMQNCPGHSLPYPLVR